MERTFLFLEKKWAYSKLYLKSRIVWILESSHFWSLLGQGVAGCIEAVQLPCDRAFILQNARLEQLRLRCSKALLHCHTVKSLNRIHFVSRLSQEPITRWWIKGKGLEGPDRPNPNPNPNHPPSDLFISKVYILLFNNSSLSTIPGFVITWMNN